jgi:hypothetical protein
MSGRRPLVERLTCTADEDFRVVQRVGVVGSHDWDISSCNELFEHRAAGVVD